MERELEGGTAIIQIFMLSLTIEWQFMVSYTTSVKFVKGCAIMHERIEINPMVCHGKPVIKGTRVMVSTILGALAAGDSTETILEDYPHLQQEDITAALVFASDLSQFEDIPYQLTQA